MSDVKKYTINISFEEAKLPPFRDILVMGRHSLQGKIGLGKSFELMVPNSFEMIELDDEHAEAIFVNKKILVKMPKEKIIAILKDRVFPFVSRGELLKVDFRVAITYSSIEEELL
jgi:hypothetical protein